MLRKLLTGVRVFLPKALTRTLSTTTTIVSSSSSPSAYSSQPAFAMKNVTRKNFESALETLRATLRDADFVALDIEMTDVVSAAACIAALDVPINSHDEQNFGGRSDQDVKKLSEDVPINSHDKENFDGRSDQEVKKLFEIWIAKHDKSYNDLMEREKIFRIFEDSLLYIDQHNAGSHSYKMGLHQFSDLTYEEFRSPYLGARCS